MFFILQEIDHVTCGAPEIENTVRHSVDIGNQNSSNAEVRKLSDKKKGCLLHMYVNHIEYN